MKKTVVIITIGDKVIKGILDDWVALDNSEMLQITIGNKTYFTHSKNVLIILESEKKQ